MPGKTAPRLPGYVTDSGADLRADANNTTFLPVRLYVHAWAVSIPLTIGAIAKPEPARWQSHRYPPKAVCIAFHCRFPWPPPVEIADEVNLLRHWVERTEFCHVPLDGNHHVLPCSEPCQGLLSS